jgi:hypothetical protein
MFKFFNLKYYKDFYFNKKKPLSLEYSLKINLLKNLKNFQLI